MGSGFVIKNVLESKVKLMLGISAGVIIPLIIMIISACVWGQNTHYISFN